MIYRYMYQGFHKSEDIKVKSRNCVTNLSLAIFNDKIFMYFESEDRNINPNDIVSENIIPYPSGELWQQMMDIFHYSKPLSKEHWKRKIENKKPIFQIIYLKPEMVSSYIFYHYQYQEERPGECDKYGAIFIFGNLLVMYLEAPEEQETEYYNGKLTTNNTPSNWAELMAEHFAPWQDFDGDWRQIKNYDL